MNAHSLLHSRAFNIASMLFFWMLYTLFLYRHITALRSGDLNATILIFIVMEAILLVLYTIRKQPKARATSVWPWAAALAGTFTPLLLSPFDTTTIHTSIGQVLMITGGLLAIGSYLSLNTSHGTAPALREVKTRGLYSFIRHPMYCSYFILFTGYILLTFSIYNTLLILFTFLCLIVRIFFEEVLLSQDSAYTAYKSRVRYRLLPFVF